MDILYLFPPESNPERHCTGCDTSFPATTEFFRPQKNGKYGLTSRCRSCINARIKTWRQRPEVRERLATRHRNYLQRPEVQAHRRAYKHEYYRNNPDYRKRKLAHDKAYRDDPKNHDRILARKRSYSHRPDVRAHRLRHGKVFRSHPENHARKLVQDQQYRNRPGYREYRHRYLKDYVSRPGYSDRIRMYGANRRALKRAVAGTYTPSQIAELLKRQRYRCYYAACGYAKFKKVKGKYLYHIDHTFPLSRVAGTDIPANNIEYLVLTCEHCNETKSNKFPWEWPEGGKLL